MRDLQSGDVEEIILKKETLFFRHKSIVLAYFKVEKKLYKT